MLGSGLTHYRSAMPFGNRQKYFRVLEDLFSSVLSQYKKYHPSGNLKFNNLGIFQNLKLPILVEKIPPIALKPKSTSNTLGCNGLWVLPLLTRHALI